METEKENEYIFEAIFHTLKLIENCNKAIAMHKTNEESAMVVIASYEKRRLQHLAHLAELLSEFQIVLPLEMATNSFKQAA
jgi:hypothetical protein